MTALESAILAALGEQAIHKAAEDEVNLSVLKSALDDLMVAQAALQVECERRGAWLRAISELTSEKDDLDDARNLAAVALHEARYWPPRDRGGR